MLLTSRYCSVWTRFATPHKKTSHLHRTKIVGYRKFPNKYGTERMLLSVRTVVKRTGWLTLNLVGFESLWSGPFAMRKHILQDHGKDVAGELSVSLGVSYSTDEL